MATSHFFNNKVIKLPGAYAAVRAEAPAAFASASYSKVLIINTNLNYSCCNKTINLTISKAKHYIILFFSFHLTSYYLTSLFGLGLYSDGIVKFFIFIAVQLCTLTPSQGFARSPLKIVHWTIFRAFRPPLPPFPAMRQHFQAGCVCGEGDF